MFKRQKSYKNGKEQKTFDWALAEFKGTMNIIKVKTSNLKSYVHLIFEIVYSITKQGYYKSVVRDIVYEADERLGTFKFLHLIKMFEIDGKDLNLPDTSKIDIILPDRRAHV